LGAKVFARGKGGIRKLLKPSGSGEEARTGTASDRDLSAISHREAAARHPTTPVGVSTGIKNHPAAPVDGFAGFENGRAAAVVPFADLATNRSAAANGFATLTN
jgi:hypothetical protein